MIIKGRDNGTWSSLAKTDDAAARQLALDVDEEAARADVRELRARGEVSGVAGRDAGSSANPQTASSAVAAAAGTSTEKKCEARSATTRKRAERARTSGLEATSSHRSLTWAVAGTGAAKASRTGPSSFSAPATHSAA